MLGAHYDHLGIYNGYTWNGADDNGSGTVGVMTIAKAIMETGLNLRKLWLLPYGAPKRKALLVPGIMLQNLPYPKNQSSVEC